MACVVPVYHPRDAEHTVLHQVIGEHLEAFLRAAAEAGDGSAPKASWGGCLRMADYVRGPADPREAPQRANVAYAPQHVRTV